MNPEDTYKTNIAFFKKNFPQIKDIFSLELKNCKIVEIRQGITLTYRVNNEDYFIHSKYNPQRESLRILETYDLKADHIVVLGVGLGYLVEKVARLKQNTARLLILEPNVEIFLSSMYYLNWKEILSYENVYFYIGFDKAELSKVINNYLDFSQFDKIEIISLPSEERLFKEVFDNIRYIIDNEIKTMFYDFKTRLAENYSTGNNILKNLKYIIKTRRVKYLKNRFKDYPAIIVGAGPSLDKNILYLNKINNRAVIIAVDTALKPLLKAGIQPHFTVVADPSYKNYLHLLGTEKKVENFLITETSIANEVYKKFYNRIFTTTIGKPIFRIIEDIIGEYGELNAWGSVISLAINFAIFLGLNPIIFVGQDFAYTDLRNHCRGTSWEDNWLQYNNNIDDFLRRERKSIGGIGKSFEQTDIYNKKVLTSDKLLLYKNYFLNVIEEYKNNIDFINATEGGILRELKNMRLIDVIEEYVFKNKKFDIDMIRRIKPDVRKENLTKLMNFFKNKIKFFKSYLKKIDDFLNLLEEKKGLPLEDRVTLLNDADDLKNLLYNDSKNAEIVEMWSQAPIYHFLRKFKKLENKVIDKDILEKSLNNYSDYFIDLKPLLENLINSFNNALNSIKDNV